MISKFQPNKHLNMTIQNYLVNRNDRKLCQIAMHNLNIINANHDKMFGIQIYTINKCHII